MPKRKPISKKRKSTAKTELTAAAPDQKIPVMYW